MNQLHIYPTSRALRTITETYKKQDGFLPTLMRMDEFEQRCMLLDNKKQIDPLRRILLLQRAANFEAFKALKLDLTLVRFFTKSDALFKFFEELALENVSFETLKQADAYAEFETHLQILQTLLENYQIQLDSLGFTDKAFVPQHYRLNEDFIRRYEHIEVHIEGYLNRFELELLDTIAGLVSLTIHFITSVFNVKMQDAFKQYGIDLPNHKSVSFSLSRKEILSVQENPHVMNVEVIVVEERLEQVAVAFVEIERMVSAGIKPEKIVLVLPDEDFKAHFMLYDAHNNLNFAMGMDYSAGVVYKLLDSLYHYWQKFESKYKIQLIRYGVNLEVVEQVALDKKVNAESFFELMEVLGLHESPLLGQEKEHYSKEVYEKYLHFLKVFNEETLSIKEWLFLWLKSLSKIMLDDVRGGKITVMGVLETRGMCFEGVVVVDFNEGIVPATSSKDQFLNTSVRAYANLPTKSDREALQKQYYKRLLEQAKTAVVVYSASDNKLPSKFLYELGLEEAKQEQAQFDLLYAQESQLKSDTDPVVTHFDATSIIWSASRLKTFLDCKRQYYYHYIQNIQAKKEEELNEGAFLHTLLDHLFREHSSYANKEEMHKQMDSLLDALLPFEDAKTNYQKLLWKEKLKGFMETQITHFKAGWKVVEREKEFHGEIGGLQFKGRIDRIDKNDTHTLVLDYKSGSTTEAQKTKNIESLNDLQMSIYFQMLSKSYQNITLAFVRLFENGEIEEINALKEKNERLGEVIIELKQTKNFVAEKCDDLQKCKYCEFALMCERGEYL